jgi:hypothetical protein
MSRGVGRLSRRHSWRSRRTATPARRARHLCILGVCCEALRSYACARYGLRLTRSGRFRCANQPAVVPPGPVSAKRPDSPAGRSSDGSYAKGPAPARENTRRPSRPTGTRSPTAGRRWTSPDHYVLPCAAGRGALAKAPKQLSMVHGAEHSAAQTTGRTPQTMKTPGCRA